MLGEAYEKFKAHLAHPSRFAGLAEEARALREHTPYAIKALGYLTVFEHIHASSEEAYFRQVYEDFVELKKKCGEATEGLTVEKFAAKLRQNRDQLVTKYSCKAVKFQVYVKDGRAALKAAPVKG